MSMTCKELYEFLERYVAGKLPDVTAEEFSRHLEACPPCADYLDCYRKTIELGRGACCDEANPPDKMPDALVQAILKSARKTDG